MSIVTDLTGLLTPAPPAASEYRQGVIMAISLSAQTNSIAIGGDPNSVNWLTNVPTVTPTDAVNYAVGTVVLLLRVGASWCIIGRPSLPGSGNAGKTSAGGTLALGTYTPNLATSALALGHTVDLSGVPWANHCSVIAIARSNAQNNSATLGYLHLSVDINGDGPHPGNNGAVGGMAGSAVAGQYAYCVASNMVSNIAITGGSLVINGFAWVTNPTGNLSWGAAGSVSEYVIDYLCTFTRQ